MTATPIEVILSYEFEGHGWLEVPCPDDWWTFRELPLTFRHEGRVYGRSAFNSDRKVAYYTTRQAS